MKEAIGGGWLFTLVIAFVALFACFISVSVNYSKCYKVKDEILNAIEKGHGVNEETITNINSYLADVTYRSKGECPKDGNCWYRFSVNNNKNTASYAADTNYCIAKHSVVSKVSDTKNKNYASTNGAIGHPESAYYSVAVFFRFDMPVIGDMFQIDVTGETSLIYLTNDKLLNSGRCA